MTRRGRPRGALGPEALATLSLASARPVTYLDLHREIGLSRVQAIETVRRGRRDGWLIDAGSTRIPGSYKPVVQVKAQPTLDSPPLVTIAHLLATHF